MSKPEKRTDSGLKDGGRDIYLSERSDQIVLEREKREREREREGENEKRATLIEQL